ncbi:hypothetical protein [Deinococcus hopiensis]|uniref:hypothetical protein n=1 Tax=Deinococcus hopiensis TaxID=309885 RepID=UPI00111BF014|nr:hypothetical protein [Deinococcus hopiensis]
MSVLPKKVEVGHRWFNRFRRIQTRWEKRQDLDLGFVELTACLRRKLGPRRTTQHIFQSRSGQAPRGRLPYRWNRLMREVFCGGGVHRRLVCSPTVRSAGGDQDVASAKGDHAGL